MSDNLRYHSKLHGKAHHTDATDAYYDSATDPIANSTGPFRGDFHLSGAQVIYMLPDSINTDTSTPNPRTLSYDDFIRFYDGTYTTVRDTSGSWTATGNSKWTIAGNNLYSQTIGNYIGVGTQTPNEMLTVTDNVSAQGRGYFGTTGEGLTIGNEGNLKFFTGATTGEIQSDASLYFGIDQDNNSTTEKFAIFNNGNSGNVLFNVLESGNVGIGVAGPSRKLHIAGTAGDGRIRVSNSGSESSTVIDIDNDDADAEVGIYGGASDTFQIRHGTTGAATARLAIQTDGKIGIGTAAPNHELTVVGDISASGTIHDVDSVPAGAIMAYAGSTVPTDWLLCDGSEIDRAIYSGLFTAISTTYGSGDGSNTFNLPDLRGRVPVGVDAMNNSVGTGGGAANRVTGATTLGQVSGSETVRLSAHEMPSHRHSLHWGSSGPLDAGPLNWNDDYQIYFGAPTNTGYAGGPANDGDAGAPHHNMPPHIILNYIIKT